MLDVVYGSGDRNELAQHLCESIQHMRLDGTLYFSHPTFKTADTEELTRVDALLVSENGEIIVFDLSTNRRNERSVDEWVLEIENRQNELYRNINVLLRTNLNRLNMLKPIVNFRVITIVENFPKEKLKGNTKLATFNTLQNVLETDEPLKNQQIDAINSAIHGITKLASKSSRKSIQYRGFDASILDIKGGKIACLDKTQIQAALSCPQGPQRIRGLAGSGKTTVLALKAAHLHIANPDWSIAITFRNVALGPYIRSLIQRFMKGIAQKEPDWSKLHIVEALGRDDNFYGNIVRHHHLSMDMERLRSGRDPFDGIFKQGMEKLEKIQSREKLYHAILIDDAQELPISFLRFAYEAARHPKRVIWASDDLQNLIGYMSIPPKDLFGNNKDGRPKVALRNRKYQPPQDIVLGICYRSTAQALTIAHGLACGIHREIKSEGDKQIIQMYDDPMLWENIGYEVVDGKLEHGEPVSLRRNRKCNVVAKIRKVKSQPNNTIYFKHFNNPIAQWRWISNRIKNDITIRKLLPRDILIIFPDLSAALRGHQYISTGLEKWGILSDVIRPPMRRDQIFARDSVKVANIFGAKEVEFPMVYFANAHECLDGTNPIKMRNKLYTGITRSFAWVRLCGVGRRGKVLEAEFQNIVKDKYTLNFNYPTQQETKDIEKYYHQVKPHKIQVDRKISEFNEFINMVGDNKIAADDLPSSLRKKLVRILEQ